MWLFDFLRKRKTEEGTKIEKELSLENIRERMNKEEKNLKDSSIKIEEMTKYLLSDLIPKLKNNLILLKSVTLDKRKEDERLKNVVRENIKLYSSFFEKLIKDLENFILENYSNEYIIKINNIYENFSKSSAKSYQRASILVGAQFEAIQKTFKNFSQEFKMVIKEDFENRKRIEKLSKFTDNFHKISESKNIEEHVRTIILKLNAEKIEKEKEIVKGEEEIKNLKESDSYRKDLKEKEIMAEELRKLESDLQTLQKKIDLKDLARTYHTNEKRHRIIQDFIKDFKDSMEKDERIELAKIIKEARGLDVDFGEIINNRKRLANYTTKSEIIIKELEKEIENIKKIVSEIEKNKKTEEKRLNKFSGEKENLINELKSEAKEFFVNKASL